MAAAAEMEWLEPTMNALYGWVRVSLSMYHRLSTDGTLD
jgi:hypothetical protein